MNAPFDQLSAWLKEHKITEVECVISDLTGIARGKIAPTNKVLHERGMRLPFTLEDALARMEDCDTVKQYLGETFVRGYVAVKRAEHENFKRVISSWEREFLLLSV